jgi:glycosyltransferase involved in cell wall biosynthesis
MQSQHPATYRCDSSLSQPSQAPNADLGDGTATEARHAVPAPSGTQAPCVLNVALLTGGFDRPYAFGIATALAAHGVWLEVIGSDEVDGPEMHTTRGIDFRNLKRNWNENATAFKKVIRLAGLYWKMILYAVFAKPKIFHILWNTRVEWFDRTILMLLYKTMRRKVVLTAHNVNTANRDGSDSIWNRLTLRFQYRLLDHIFVHTELMRSELISHFGVHPARVTVIPFGINNSLPNTDLTPAEAKSRLRIHPEERVLLFFGRIQPYKGLESLIEALDQLARRGDARYRLIIAGAPKREYLQYWTAIRQKIDVNPLIRDLVLPRIEFIPDADVEVYFKAADVTVLPYRDIYQSGVLFLGYSFGLPVIATDVGSFREEIVEGETGYLCQPGNAEDLGRTITTYFDSDLFRNLNGRRARIRSYANERYSWQIVGDITCKTYAELIQGRRP